MQSSEDWLIEHLKARVLAGKPLSAFRRNQAARPPVSHAELVQAEDILGFALPPLLKRLYLEVGDGGFGPGYGLFPLNSEDDPEARYLETLVTSYRALRSITPEQIAACRASGIEPPDFPEKLLSICDHGCSIYSWLDASQEEAPILRSDQTADCREFTIEASSLQQWFEEWLRKDPL